jgi:penicillin-insensitive murein DD-endopeptidase
VQRLCRAVGPIAILLFAEASHAQGPANLIDLRWSAQRTPAAGPPSAIGAYAGGCVQGAVSLPLSGTGYQVVRPSRHRSFGHPDLIGFIKRLAGAVKIKKLGVLIVGDLAQARGGPTPSGHRSHQSGLDVDLWYTFPAPAAQRPLTSSERERTSPGVLVDLKTRNLTPLWSPAISKRLELAASDPAVDRIFVHPAVKRALCAQFSPKAEWLRRIRPWWGHHDHFHVRLRCPIDSPDCEAQDPLPGEAQQEVPFDDGCGTTLDWWFTEEARSPAPRPTAVDPILPTTPVPVPPLPEACTPLLQ